MLEFGCVMSAKEVINICPFDRDRKCYIDSDRFGDCPERPVDCLDYEKYLRKILG